MKLLFTFNFNTTHTMTIVHKCLFESLWMTFRVPELYISADFPTQSTQLNTLLQTNLLKNGYRGPLHLAPFSSLFDRVADHFFLGLSLSPAGV